MKHIFKPLLISIILLTLGLFSCQEAEEKTQLQKAIKQPNILFISIDDLRPELGCYGNSYIKTPNLDAFSNAATQMNNAYCQAAVCAPSRASLMTGLRPDSTRVWHLGDEFRKTIPNVVTMPQFFHSKGYYTACIGKIFHNYMPDSASWDEPDMKPAPYDGPEYNNRDAETIYHLKESQEAQEEAREKILKRFAKRKKIYADGWFSGPAIENADLPDSVFYDGLQTKLAIKTINRLKDRTEPFFLALGYFRPHLPFVAPKKYWDMYPKGSIPIAKNTYLPTNVPPMAENANYELRNYTDFKQVNRPSGKPLHPDSADLLKRGYYACVSYVDACVGQLIDELKKQNLYDNTIIVIWGDHGWKLGEHNGWGKQTNFNIDTRVPILFKGVNQKEKVVSDALTELVDLFPTICDLANVEKPNYLQGSSMVPLIENPNRPWKKAVFSQFRRRAKISSDQQEYMGYAMQTNRYHYIEWYTWDNETKQKGQLAARELYDHENDAEENHNIADQESMKPLVISLSVQLKENWKGALPYAKE